MLSQCRQNCPEMFIVILTSPAVDEDVINEHYDESVQIWSQDPVHQIRENRWGVSQPKRHDCELK
ncbi:hypothetical protein Scep_014740 [Stephania cephalantha]|uniref:Uncharacterized protein n=1 Tax=Stephania cephalantha TaxID=152367 RepID=A0AAP0J1U1_9MAGN